ncbi:DUF2236 domain-containing protein [Antrihabitans sp. YC3-6]|uniref:DUF2236 domain-containing protein n=1 Tax=Antrihabitans stalagmiti TaxID=2799499 RepID=A0A934U604_9NOCA|nr:oxygenase MpaB family protein [Antrihabitans stalagmiti]MBJ8342075.1 DUF2236 domain-containing protein [Antrihabitans stalagmiti]
MPEQDLSVPRFLGLLGTRGKRARTILETPREDDGFFSPDGVARRVMSSPTAMIGALRCSIVEMLDPPSAVALGQHSTAYQDPVGRALRSLTLIVMLVFGDRKTATHASDIWFRIHERINGVLPASDQPYRALDLDNLLWIFLTGWHSFYISYQEFGTTPLTADETDRYFAEGAAAAVMMGIPAHLIPDTHAKVVKYFAEVRPELVLTPEGLSIVDLLMRPGTKPRLLIAGGPFLRIASRAAVSNLPRDLRRLGQFDAPAWVFATSRILVGAAMRVMSIRRLYPAVGVIAPDMWAVLEQSDRWTAAQVANVVAVADPRPPVDEAVAPTPPYEQLMWPHLSKG